eukprot:gnl/TRDRNA2_/TRDRNA2_103860_c0_seq1.p1 gnl/TRDRNA2_/TRDRNA2_103860_c0~~gnl/TRDRNA2_/TRDRNA2_103860_c0_seq1.p1  ORF type:complete len:403 (-),score=32.55 gnl/TRDRNA2_/TRDRNA2_103860_c0_seq1:31-1239(-)
MLATLLFCIFFVVKRKTPSIAAPNCYSPKSSHAVTVRLVQWLGDPGCYTNLDLTVSLYLMLTLYAVFVGHIYQPLTYYGGSLVASPTTAATTVCKYVSMYTAGVASVCHFFAWVPLMQDKYRIRARMSGLLFVWAAAGSYLALRIRNFYFTLNRPNEHTLLMVDWMLVGIWVSLSVRSLGVPEWICSAWLRKFTVTTLAMYYFNAGMCKLLNTGIRWANGQLLAQFISSQRGNSAWPWLSDKISSVPWIAESFAIATMIFELPVSLLAAIGCSCCRPAKSSGLDMLRVVWSWMAIAFHLGIYMFMFPTFTVEAHIQLVLVLDPFAHFAKDIDAKESTCDDGQGHDAHPTASESSSTLTVAAIWSLAAILMICICMWLYVGLKFHTTQKDPIFPFTSNPMYSM